MAFRKWNVRAILLHLASPQALNLRAMDFIQHCNSKFERAALVLFCLHGRFCCLESDFGMVAVTERLVDGSAAATERDFLFPGQVVAIPLSISQFQLRQIACHHEWAILECNRFNRHRYFLRELYCESVLRNDTANG